MLSHRHPQIRSLEKSKIVRILSCAGFATNSGPSPQPNQDLYGILGVERTASSKEIKAAYYELSKKYHPDVAGSTTSDAKRFHEITEAYDTLGNEDKRRVYDEQQQAARRVFDASTGYGDPDLETLREFQRKWNLRRQKFDQDRANRMKSDFDMKHDTEEFESFYKRYRDNLAKARQWDEHRDAETRFYQGTRREQFSDFQKEMLRNSYKRQAQQDRMSYITAVVVLVGSLAFLLGLR